MCCTNDHICEPPRLVSLQSTLYCLHCKCKTSVNVRGNTMWPKVFGLVYLCTVAFLHWRHLSVANFWRWSLNEPSLPLYISSHNLKKSRLLTKVTEKSYYTCPHWMASSPVLVSSLESPSGLKTTYGCTEKSNSNVQLGPKNCSHLPFFILWSTHK